MQSFASKKIGIGKSKIGNGIFAKEKISKGELIVDFSTGPGKYLSTIEANKLYEQGNDYMIQVDDDLFFVVTDNAELEDVDFINHSCDPNCGIHEKLKIVAMYNINPNEEITIDYAMCESSDYKMECKCGTMNCRKIITGNDWKNPILQKKYYEFFSDYLQKKINKEFATKEQI